MDFNDFAVLTFDCYGTLIDWETGIWAALQPLLTHHKVEVARHEALVLYGELEAAIEAGPYREYKMVLRLVLEGMGARLGFTPSPDEYHDFAMSVRDWPAFADSPHALQALHRRYKLAVISNIDDDLFAFSAERLQAPFDWVITARQARSYKPSPHNFRLAFQRIALPTDQILHVAQSLYHDIAPAKSLGLAAVWVNRRHDKEGSGATPPTEATPDLEVPDLQTLAKQMGLM